MKEKCIRGQRVCFSFRCLTSHSLYLSVSVKKEIGQLLSTMFSCHCSFRHKTKSLLLLRRSEGWLIFREEHKPTKHEPLRTPGKMTWCAVHFSDTCLKRHLHPTQLNRAHACCCLLCCHLRHHLHCHHGCMQRGSGQILTRMPSPLSLRMEVVVVEVAAAAVAGVGRGRQQRQWECN